MQCCSLRASSSPSLCRWHFILALISLLLIVLISESASAAQSQYPPVVVLHGITGDSSDLLFMSNVIQKHLPGTYVKNVNLGGDYSSVFRSITDQIARFCMELAKDPNLTGGFNLIGTSQGGVIARGYVERCNSPPVLNFVSWVAPQGGQFGVPGYVNTTLEKVLDEIVECCIYEHGVQEMLSFAGYWRDPYMEEKFLNRSIFLADADNLRPRKNILYRQRISSLKNLIMGYSLVDEILRPKETGWFAHFAPKTESSIMWLEDTQMYQQDWIGLKTLDESGRIHRFTTMCKHEDYDSNDCFLPVFMQNVMPFLAIPLAELL